MRDTRERLSTGFAGIRASNSEKIANASGRQRELLAPGNALFATRAAQPERNLSQAATPAALTRPVPYFTSPVQTRRAFQSKIASTFYYEEIVAPNRVVVCIL
jgi:hypothetical protein